jgi:hypothetical protein
MASTYSDLKIQLMATGENNTTWGDITNNNWTALSEAVTGSADVTFASADVTLTLTDTNAAQTARNLRLNLTGTSGGARNLIVPAIEKLYLVNNGVADTVTVKTSAGTGIAVPSGKSMWVFCDATNVVAGVTALTSLALGTALNVANGGTGATTLTGIVKGSGTSAFSAATAGTDYVAPGTATNFTATQTFSGSTSVAGAKLLNALEACTVSATAATGTINYDVTTQSVLYYTTNASANWTVNFRGSSGTALNSVMAVGESVTVAFLVTQGGTAYYNNAVQVDGNSVTPKYQGGTAWSAGNASSVDAYTYVIVKTGSAAFTVFAAQTQFK